MLELRSFLCRYEVLYAEVCFGGYISELTEKSSNGSTRDGISAV